jgi:hypothetical protein
VADTNTVSTAAMAALTTALLNEGAYYDESHELGITRERDMNVVRELVGLLADVTVREWNGAAERFRSYRGTLPCGLRLDVITVASAERIEL